MDNPIKFSLLVLFNVIHLQKTIGTHIQWETALGIFINIGKQLTTPLVSKEGLSGIGLIRF